ncbi:MAG: hypothetical protein JXQ90_13850 [Cyclobacteriaceae bacterium]
MKIKSTIPWGKLGLELLVVFLGVSAGFVMNGWRAEANEKDLQDKYIQGFIEDINSNVTELVSAIEKDSSWIAQSTPVIKSMMADTFHFDSLNDVVQSIVQLSRVDLRSTTYQNMTNSGNHVVIDEFELRNDLIEYHNVLDGVGFIEDYFQDYFNQMVMPVVFREFNFLTGRFKKEVNFASIDFNNSFVGYYSLVLQRRKAYQDALDGSKEMLKKLSVE